MLLSFLFLLSVVQGVVVAFGFFFGACSGLFFVFFSWRFVFWPVCFALFLRWWVFVCLSSGIVCFLFLPLWLL